jgi:hypothetical protein
MTSEVTTIALNFGGTDLGDIDGILIDRVIQGGPDEPSMVRGRDDVAPGKDGRVLRNRRSDVRRIEIRGWVTGTGADTDAQVSDYWDNRVALGTLMNPTTTQTLTATLKNGASYTIEARPVDPPTYDQVAPMLARVSILMESIDPDWEAAGS